METPTSQLSSSSDSRAHLAANRRLKLYQLDQRTEEHNLIITVDPETPNTLLDVSRPRLFDQTNPQISSGSTNEPSKVEELQNFKMNVTSEPDLETITLGMRIDEPAKLRAAPRNPEESKWQFGCLIFSIGMWIFTWIIVGLFTTSQDLRWAYSVFGLFAGCYYLNCIIFVRENYFFRAPESIDMGKLCHKLKNAQASLFFNIECYHYETKNFLGNTIDKTGKIFPNSDTYQVRVVTYNAKKEIEANECIDVTGNVEGQIEFLTSLEVYKNFRIFDRVSDERLQNLKNMFFMEHNKDTYHDFEITLEIEGLKDKYIVHPVGKKMSKWTSGIGFFLWSLIGLSWFYRLWFYKHTDYKQMTLLKSFKF